MRSDHRRGPAELRQITAKFGGTEQSAAARHRRELESHDEDVFRGHVSWQLGPFRALVGAFPYELVSSCRPWRGVGYEKDFDGSAGRANCRTRSPRQGIRFG